MFITCKGFCKSLPHTWPESVFVECAKQYYEIGIQNKRQRQASKSVEHLCACIVCLDSITFGYAMKRASMSSQFAVFQSLSICKMRFQCNSKWDTRCQIYYMCPCPCRTLYALSSKKNANSKFHIMLTYCRDCVNTRTLAVSIQSVLQIKRKYCWMSEYARMQWSCSKSSCVESMCRFNILWHILLKGKRKLLLVPLHLVLACAMCVLKKYVLYVNESVQNQFDWSSWFFFLLFTVVVVVVIVLSAMLCNHHQHQHCVGHHPIT